MSWEIPVGLPKAGAYVDEGAGGRCGVVRPRRVDCCPLERLPEELQCHGGGGLGGAGRPSHERRRPRHAARPRRTARTFCTSLIFLGFLIQECGPG